MVRRFVRISLQFGGGGTSSIPDGVKNFYFCPGSGCMLFVLSCVVSGSGPDILLTTDFMEARLCVSV